MSRAYLGELVACSLVLGLGFGSPTPASADAVGIASESCVTDNWWDDLGSANFNDTVDAMTMWNGNLVVVGDFTKAGDVLLNHVAIWNGCRWSPIGEDGEPVGTNGHVDAVAVLGNELIIAGEFTMVGNTPAKNIARWDGSQWKLLGTGVSIANGSSANVNTLAVVGGKLVVGGRFDRADGALAVNSLALWSEDTGWSNLGGGGQTGVTGGNFEVHSIKVWGGDTLAVGGDFANAVQSGNSIAAKNVALWAGDHWSALGSGLSGKVFAVERLGSTFYAGGEFSGRIAQWNGVSWQTVGGGVSSTVRGLQADGDGLLVCGLFATAGSGASLNSQARRFTRWDGSTWASFGSGLDNPTFTALRFGGDIVVGGNFGGTYDDLAGFGKIGRWTGTEWRGFGNGSDDAISVMAIFQGIPYISDTDQAGDATKPSVGNGIYRMIGNAKWQFVAAPQSGSVTGMFSSGDQLTIYGSFENIGGVGDKWIVTYDGVDWQRYSSNDPDENLPGPVTVAAWHDGELYAAGRLGSVTYVRKWTGAAWVDIGGQVLNSDGIRAMVSYEGELVVGGRFTSIGGVEASNVAAWNGSQWEPLGPGPGGWVFHLVPWRDGLIASGTIIPSTISWWSEGSWHSINGPISTQARSTDVVVNFNNRLVCVRQYNTPLVKLFWLSDPSGAWEEIDDANGDISIACPQYLDGERPRLWLGGNFTKVNDRGSHHIARWSLPAGIVPVATVPTAMRLDSGAGVVSWYTSGDDLGVNFALFRSMSGGRDGEMSRLAALTGNGSGKYEFVDQDAPREACSYWLREIGRGGTVDWYGPAILSSIEAPELPASLTLSAWPNPFRTALHIRYQGPALRSGRLTVHDVSGRLVTEIATSGTVEEANEWIWDGYGRDSRRVASGIYYVRMESEGAKAVVRVVVAPQ